MHISNESAQNEESKKDSSSSNGNGIRAQYASDTEAQSACKGSLFEPLVEEISKRRRIKYGYSEKTDSIFSC